MFTLTIYNPSEPWKKHYIVRQKLALKLQHIKRMRLITLKKIDIAHGKSIQ